MRVVQFSTGIGSAEVARRELVEHGPDEVVLLTADTRVEDADNWRFAHEFVDRFGQGALWVILADGRTPMQVGRDRKVVPNNRMAVCSEILKRRLLRAWIDEHCDPEVDVMVLGFDWTEPQRLAAAEPHWEPFRCDAPLMRPPLVDKASLLEEYRIRRRIEPPRLYEQGFSHANCGGACVRGGQKAWARLLRVNPERYRRWELEERASQALLGKDVAILRDRRGGTTKPLPLRDFRLRIERDASDHDGDEGACACFGPEEPTP